MAFTSTRFAGTSVSGSHIGDTESKRLAALIASDQTTPAILTVSVGPETANVINVSFSLLDSNGDPLARPTLAKVTIYDENGDLPGPDFEIQSPGAITNPGGNLVIMATGLDGLGAFDVEDKTGAAVANIFAVIEPIDAICASALAGLSFA